LSKRSACTDEGRRSGALHMHWPHVCRLFHADTKSIDCDATHIHWNFCIVPDSTFHFFLFYRYSNNCMFITSLLIKSWANIIEAAVLRRACSTLIIFNHPMFNGFYITMEASFHWKGIYCRNRKLKINDNFIIQLTVPVSAGITYGMGRISFDFRSFMLRTIVEYEKNF
jgi:hypothetical protein